MFREINSAQGLEFLVLSRKRFERKTTLRAFVTEYPDTRHVRVYLSFQSFVTLEARGALNGISNLRRID